MIEAVWGIVVLVLFLRTTLASRADDRESL